MSEEARKRRKLFIASAERECLRPKVKGTNKRAQKQGKEETFHIARLQKTSLACECTLIAKCKMQNAKQGGARTEREKRVLSPLGLTFPRNRVLRPFWARFSLGMVVCTAGGANGDSGGLLWRFRGRPSCSIRTQQSISIRNAIKTTERILSAYYKC